MWQTASGTLRKKLPRKQECQHENITQPWLIRNTAKRITSTSSHMITSQEKTSRTKINHSQGSNVKLWQCWQSCKCQKMPLKQLGNNLWHKFLAPQSVWNMFAIIVSFLVTDKQNPTAWEEIISPCFACVEQLKKVLGWFVSKQTSISYFISHW